MGNAFQNNKGSVWKMKLLFLSFWLNHPLVYASDRYQNDNFIEVEEITNKQESNTRGIKYNAPSLIIIYIYIFYFYSLSLLQTHTFHALFLTWISPPPGLCFRLSFEPILDWALMFSFWVSIFLSPPPGLWSLLSREPTLLVAVHFSFWDSICNSEELH